MAVKWWGWGDPDKTYDLTHRPAAWPYLQAKLGVRDEVQRSPVALDDIQLPSSRLDAAVLEALTEVGCSTRGQDRISHAYGKSYRDLVRVRAGHVPNPPDAVVFPTNEAQVEAVLALAARHGFAVIPFGGGTSVVGGLEMPADRAERPFVSLDLARMSALIEVDPVSMTATAEAGIMGPRLEELLQAQGVTLGHYPQSFEYSTLGGWVATRSAGQQSTRYGKIESMVVGLRILTPAGVLETRPVPAASQGPDLNQVAIGSEGLLGVITRVTFKVHARPPRQDYRALVFPGWAQGQAALRAIMQSDRRPATLRLSDQAETRALFKLREASKPSAWKAWGQKAFGWYLSRMRDVHMEDACLLIMGFEGDPEQVDQDRDWCVSLCELQRGVSLGHAIADRWYASRFDLPYLRDTMLDRGVMVDTLETSGLWANVPAIYEAVIKALEGAISADGLDPLVFCHVSHPYAAGASLYFTFAARQQLGQELEQWARYKRAATDALLAAGGSLSHHHGVGIDHAPWAREVLGDQGLAWIKGVKAAADPDDIMGPGRIIGS
ncbi:MAG: Alkylglycerone-phosphate synthase [Cyanobacteria bacterium RYN_339]|nr:Alkylglycerone-phosphate synthase [Cyanobacteria bacterium RYN_339]